jgi:dihydrofolate reductase
MNNFVEAVFAIDSHGGMGYKNALPWPRNKEDMKFFSEITKNSILIMGRKTWESDDMIRPLPKRKNIVLTKSPELYREKYESILHHVSFVKSSDPEEIIKFCARFTEQNPHYYRKIVIGGPAVLNLFLPYTRRAYITKLDQQFATDTKIDIKKYLTGFSYSSGQTLNSYSTVTEYVNASVS